MSTAVVPGSAWLPYYLLTYRHKTSVLCYRCRRRSELLRPNRPHYILMMLRTITTYLGKHNQGGAFTPAPTEIGDI